MLLQIGETAPEVPMPRMAPPRERGRKRNPSLDVLLEIGAPTPELRPESAPGLVLTDRQAFGIFFGVRAALLAYAVLGIAAGCAYEAWTMLFR